MTLIRVAKRIARRGVSLAQRAALAYPARVSCNLCGWTGRRFVSDGWHEGVQCPACLTQFRHRLLVAMLSHLPGHRLADLVSGKRVLHFAPETSLRRIVEPAANAYTTADFMLPGHDLTLDISSMPGVREGSFELLIACDVLEHVPDDVAALREIARVLTPDGVAILTVPQMDSPSRTIEDPSADEATRLARFGQADHVRIYGDDFLERARSAGFHVRAVDASLFPDGLRRQHVLAPPKLNPHPLATNHRRIFVARR